jgi:hypothetical protein
MRIDMDSDLAEPLDLLDPSIPDRFVDGSADTLFARLRHEAPVHYCRESRFGPFWSVSLYEDIVEIEGQPQLFSSDAKHGGISIIDVDPERGNLPRILHHDGSAAAQPETAHHRTRLHAFRNGPAG